MGELSAKPTERAPNGRTDSYTLRVMPYTYGDSIPSQATDSIHDFVVISPQAEKPPYKKHPFDRCVRTKYHEHESLLPLFSSEKRAGDGVEPRKNPRKQKSVPENGDAKSIIQTGEWKNSARRYREAR